MSGRRIVRTRRIAACGFRGVGKSTLTIQFIEGQFVDNYHPTVENTFQKTFQYRGQDYNLEIIDTAGQDEASILPNNMAIGIHGYILVYSITNRASFEIVHTIRDKILDISGLEYIPMVLVGNKTDLHLDRKITTTEGEETAKEWKCAFLELSAKSNQRANQVFERTLEEIEKTYGSPQPPQNEKCILL